MLVSLDPGMDGMKGTPLASHLCAVNPEGTDPLTRPGLQPVLDFLITRVKGLDLNDSKKLQPMQCIQGSRDQVLTLEASRPMILKWWNTKHKNLFQDAPELGYKTTTKRITSLRLLATNTTPMKRDYPTSTSIIV